MVVFQKITFLAAEKLSCQTRDNESSFAHVNCLSATSSRDLTPLKHRFQADPKASKNSYTDRIQVAESTPSDLASDVF
jgi:hypothetical protein